MMYRESHQLTGLKQKGKGNLYSKQNKTKIVIKKHQLSGIQKKRYITYFAS